MPVALPAEARSPPLRSRRAFPTSSPSRIRTRRSRVRASARARAGAVIVDRIALPARARPRDGAGGPLACRAGEASGASFALILGLIVLTIAVFYAIGYALAKAIV